MLRRSGVDSGGAGLPAKSRMASSLFCFFLRNRRARGVDDSAGGHGVGGGGGRELRRLRRLAMESASAAAAADEEEGIGGVRLFQRRAWREVVEGSVGGRWELSTIAGGRVRCSIECRGDGRRGGVTRPPQAQRYDMEHDASISLWG